ncbi:MAG: type II toxin-antitoxin system prevent-host-death family antitoxin [Rhodospirillaceae bacterium]|nr:type II toxin-antitoxin system prevent-host-death family antitoxin [Rhodospirillaceae bacterium]
MKRVSANAAKQNFGELLDSAQRHPVVVERHGRPLAVVLSYHDYADGERFKFLELKKMIDLGRAQLDRGERAPLTTETIMRAARRIAKKSKS